MLVRQCAQTIPGVKMRNRCKHKDTKKYKNLTTSSVLYCCTCRATKMLHKKVKTKWHSPKKLLAQGDRSLCKNTDHQYGLLDLQVLPLPVLVRRIWWCTECGDIVTQIRLGFSPVRPPKLAAQG